MLLIPSILLVVLMIATPGLYLEMLFLNMARLIVLCNKGICSASIGGEDAGVLAKVYSLLVFLVFRYGIEASLADGTMVTRGATRRYTCR